MEEPKVLKIIRESVLRVSLLLKGLDAALEMIGGALLLVPVPVSQFIRALCEHELLEDPHDRTATYIRGLAAGPLLSVTLAGAMYLMLHGLVKLIFIVAVFRGKLWGHLGIIVVLSLFTAYEIFRSVASQAQWFFALAFFDGLIVYLAAKEYQARRV